MSSAQLETFLARLYTDDALRRRFLAAPYDEARSAGLSDTDALALTAIDRAGLDMAATSFARKRAAHGRRSWPAKLRSLWRRLAAR